MEFEKDSITDWLQLAFTFFGGLYGLFLLNQSNKDKKAQFINDVLNRLYNDAEVRAILYSVDSGKNVKEIKYLGELEMQADKTLRYLDYIGYLVKKRHLKKGDLKPFEYEISRILNNEEIRSYYDNWLQSIGVQLLYLKYLK
jgi:hypothetical protein